MIFKFQKPDGTEIPVYVIMSPQGCKALLNITSAEMTEYEAQHGKVEAWNTTKNTVNPNSKNHAPIYS